MLVLEKVSLGLLKQLRTKDFAHSCEFKISSHRLNVIWEIQLQVRNSNHGHPLPLPNSPLIIPLTFKRGTFDQNYILSNPICLSKIHISNGQVCFRQQSFIISY